MSKNFELLRRAGWGEEYLEGIPAPAKGRKESTPIAQAGPQMTDQISVLVQRLFQKPDDPTVRSVLFLGCTENSGASSVSVRVAQKLAGQERGRVCIVDAHVDRPSVHQSLGKGNLVGLTDAVLNDRPAESFAKQVQGSNLWVVPAGSPESKRNSIFTTPHLTSSLRQLRSKFQYLLIVSPPLTSKHELAALAEAADGVVLVVTSSGVGATTALNAKERLRSVNVKMLGMVLNQSQTLLLQSLRN